MPIICFEYNENTKKYSNIKTVTHIKITSSVGYNCFMNKGFNSCYVDTEKYNENNCYVYYVRNFMRKYKKELRENKLKRILF